MQTIYALEYTHGSCKNSLQSISEKNVMNLFDSIKDTCNEFTLKKLESNCVGTDNGLKITL